MERLTVVGPYPTLEFFKRVADELNPKRVVLVVDAGWPTDEVEEIKRLFKRPTVRYASCEGLVHAKLYLTEWVSNAKRRCYLSLGSANASEPAMSQHAEATASFYLSRDSECASSVAEWFATFGEMNGFVRATDILLPGHVRVYLPGFDFTSEPQSVRFEAWLQRGWLCHKYEPDPTFGRVKFSLKKPLPKGKTQRHFADHGLVRLGDSKVITIEYVPGKVLASNSPSSKVPTSVRRWRSRFFIDTSRGHWTSDACYRALEDGFTSGGRAYRERSTLLSAVKNSSKEDRDEWVNAVVEKIRIIAESRQDAEEYLQFKEGMLDEQRYRRMAEAQVLNQHRRARVPVFEKRYVRAFEFHHVPTLRNGSQTEFHRFRESFCESLLSAKALTSRRRSAGIATSVRLALGLKRREMRELEVDDLIHRIEEAWKNYGPRKTIQDFYLDK